MEFKASRRVMVDMSATIFITAISAYLRKQVKWEP